MGSRGRLARLHPVHFGVEGLAGADRALSQLREKIAEWSRDDRVAPDQAARYETRFRSRLADDLDLPGAMALVAELVRSEIAPGTKASLLVRWDRVLGLDLDREQPDGVLPEGASALLEARAKARAANDYDTSDRLRAELAAIGVAVADTPEGQTWTSTPESSHK